MTSAPFVIAEAGVNHNGDIALARRLIEVAGDAGASAVKFQLFRADDLASAAAPTAAYQAAMGCGNSQRAMLSKLELSTSAFHELARHCRRLGTVTS